MGVNAHYAHPKRADEIHFYNPNPVIFEKKHLNDVEFNTFFHFQIHTTII